MSCPITGQQGSCPVSGAGRGRGGGCPVMSQGYPDPPLEISPCYPTYNNVANEFIISFRGIPAINSKDFYEKRQKFDKYPLFLKHTLFHGNEMVKVRKLSVMHKYVVFDDLRQKGNLKLQEKQYEIAQEFYEQAMGCYSFLHCEEYITNKQITFTDENTHYVEPQGEDSQEEDQRKQFMLMGYQSLIAIGIRLGQFRYANEALERALLISKNHPRLQAWNSVIISSNLTSSVDDLQKALKNITVAVEVEKLAIKNNPKKNKENLELFEKILEQTKNRLADAEKQKTDLIKQILEYANKRTKQHEYVLEDEELTELKLINKMDDFYKKMLSYYEESTKPEYLKIRQCRFDLQDIKRIGHQMSVVLNISFESLQYWADLQKIQMESIKEHIKIVKQQIAKNIFMEGKYHPEILSHAMENITKERQNVKKLDAKEENEWSGIWWYVLIIIVFVVIIFGARFLYKSNK